MVQLYCVPFANNTQTSLSVDIIHALDLAGDPTPASRALRVSCLIGKPNHQQALACAVPNRRLEGVFLREFHLGRRLLFVGNCVVYARPFYHGHSVPNGRHTAMKGNTIPHITLSLTLSLLGNLKCKTMNTAEQARFQWVSHFGSTNNHKESLSFAHMHNGRSKQIM